MTSHDIREKFGFSQRDLSLAFNIPLPTVRNWDAKDCMPKYIHDMLFWIYLHDEKGDTTKLKDVVDDIKKLS